VSALPKLPIYACEPVSAALIWEIEPLLTEHWREIATYKDIELRPNWGRYRELCDQGILHVFTARVGHELVGYAIYFVNHSLHYAGSLQAIQDVIYVSPGARAGYLGMKLIQWSEQYLKNLGVQVIVQHQKIAHPALGVVLKRMGYRQVDLMWSKRLDA